MLVQTVTIQDASPQSVPWRHDSASPLRKLRDKILETELSKSQGLQTPGSVQRTSLVSGLSCLIIFPILFLLCIRGQRVVGMESLFILMYFMCSSGQN